MVVFPPDEPQLRVVSVGANAIPVDSDDPVFVLLPAGSSEQQSVEVTASNFNTLVPLRVTITPEEGSSEFFDFQIDNSEGGTSTGTVQVTIPAGISSRVDVWTR